MNDRNDPLNAALSQVRAYMVPGVAAKSLVGTGACAKPSKTTSLGMRNSKRRLAMPVANSPIDSAKKSDGTKRGLTKPEQQKNLLTDARNAVKVYLGEGHPSLEYVGFTTEEWEQINLSAAISLFAIGNACARSAIALLNSSNILTHLPIALPPCSTGSEWADVVAGLCVVTGRARRGNPHALPALSGKVLIRLFSPGRSSGGIGSSISLCLRFPL